MDLMKALVITGVNQYEIQKIPVPIPKVGQVLVKVKAVTTCPQWDMHIFSGKPMFVNDPEIKFPYMPGQPGHEMTGTIAGAGEGTSIPIGTTVCAWRDPGQSRQGCYAEYVVMNESDVMEVPNHLHYTQVVSLELAMCIASTILRLKRTIGIEGKRCAVNGLGPAGLIALQMLRAEGAAEVIGIDPVVARREMALSLGANHVFEAGSQSLAERHQYSASEIAVDCVGYPPAVRYIMDRTKEAVALFAVQREDYILNHAGLSVIGYPGHFRESAEYALQRIIEGKLDLRSLISRELPMEKYGEGVQLLRNQEAIKICFIP